MVCLSTKKIEGLGYWTVLYCPSGGIGYVDYSRWKGTPRLFGGLSFDQAGLVCQ